MSIGCGAMWGYGHSETAQVHIAVWGGWGWNCNAQQSRAAYTITMQCHSLKVNKKLAVVCTALTATIAVVEDIVLNERGQKLNTHSVSKRWPVQRGSQGVFNYYLQNSPVIQSAQSAQSDATYYTHLCSALFRQRWCWHRRLHGQHRFPARQAHTPLAALSAPSSTLGFGDQALLRK